jgi:hypothetical protein
VEYELSKPHWSIQNLMLVALWSVQDNHRRFEQVVGAFEFLWKYSGTELEQRELHPNVGENQDH